MGIIDRYITRQIIVSTLFAVASLSAVLVVGNILRRLLDLLVNTEVPVDVVLKFIGFLLPFSLTYTIPWGFLTAVLLVLGRLSADNEITALRSTGHSMQRLFFPLLGLAAALSGVCLWLNGFVAPHARGEMIKLPYHLATKTPAVIFGADRVISELPGRRIYVGGKDEDGALKDITVFEIDEDRQVVRTIFARRGVIEPDADGKKLVLVLKNTNVEEWLEPGDPSSIRGGIVIQDADAVVPLDELWERVQKRGGVGAMELPELSAAIHREGAGQGGQGGQEEEAVDPVNARTEWHQRVSSSLACLAFALVGIPLGITAQRKETTIGFAISLVVAFAYFLVLFGAGNVRDKAEFYPHLLMWLPNVIFMGIGAWMFGRLCRK